MILIVAEFSNGKLNKSTYEMTQAARELDREGPITLLILGSGMEPVAAEAALLADQVLVADLPALSTYDPEVWAQAVAQIAREGDAHTVLIGGSRSGREFSPRVAVKLDAPLIEAAISLKFADGIVAADHYTFLTRVVEHVEAQAPTVVVTIHPGVFPSAEVRAEAAEQYEVDLELPAPRVIVTQRNRVKSKRVALEEAEIIVAGGRGVGSAEAFAQLVEGLADQLGAAVGATRAVVDAGWRPYSEQVGQTGKTVQPKVYFALGISGAVQHLSGMNKSKLIIAINRDREAPIFKIADYGIVGDAREITPAILENLKAKA